MSTRYSIPHLSESDGSVILQSYSVMMRYNKGSLCEVSRSPHPHAHTYMHTHTHSQWSLYGTETFYPLSVKKKLNKIIQIRDIKNITFGSPLCQQGLLWGWTSRPTWQEQDWTSIVMYSSTLPWYQWELFSHSGHQWGRARWHFTSPFPWCHWIGKGKQQGGSELSSYFTL